MPITFLKASAALLILVLFSITVTKKDVLLSYKEQFLSPYLLSLFSTATTTDKMLMPQANSVTLPLVTLSESTTTANKTSSSRTSSTTVLHTPTTSTAQKGTDIVRTKVYETMVQSSSDNDETYRPAISPCTVPMGYRIGTLDSRFGISKEKLLEEIHFSSTLWGQALGKNLFVYNENGPLTINLIYDERQAKTEQVTSLALEIENSKLVAETLRLTYEQEKIFYIGDGEQLARDSEAFQARQKLYSAKVDMFNAQGGAPRTEYDLMNKELALLKQEVAALEVRRNQLLAFMETINAKVTRYNELVVYANTLIKKSNALGAQKFTEGRFSPSTNTIDIYQYSDLIKLRRVIAHELGHAVGINHTSNAYSIMYASNSATTTVLSVEDIAALRSVCNSN